MDAVFEYGKYVFLLGFVSYHFQMLVFFKKKCKYGISGYHLSLFNKYLIYVCNSTKLLYRVSKSSYPKEEKITLGVLKESMYDNPFFYDIMVG